MLAAVAFAAHFALGGGYGYFRDELYFIACGARADWGYVDQPPLTPLVAYWAHELSAGSLRVFRLAANLSAGALVALTGMLVRRLGGGRFAIVVASVAVIIAPQFLVAGHLLTMNSFEPVLWMAVAYLALQLDASTSRRTYAAIGVLVGVGLLNKYSMALFVVALVLGLLIGGRRRLVLRWEALAAVAIASAIVAPNLAWQWSRDWPMLELLQAQSDKNAEFSFAGFIEAQVLLLHPLCAPIWCLGLVHLWRRARFLALTFALLFALFVGLKAKGYYLAPAYPMLLAAGAVIVEARCAQRLARWGVIMALVAGGAALAPLAVPVLPPERLVEYQSTLGLDSPADERHEQSALPQHLADQFGWPELAAAVDTVVLDAPGAAVFANNYGEAAALERFGAGYPVFSSHNQYWLWGPPAGDVLISVGTDRPCARFAEVVEVARGPEPAFAMPYERGLPIFVCRRPMAPVDWAALRRYR